MEDGEDDDDGLREEEDEGPLQRGPERAFETDRPVVRAVVAGVVGGFAQCGGAPGEQDWREGLPQEEKADNLHQGVVGCCGPEHPAPGGVFRDEAAGWLRVGQYAVH